VWRRDSGVLTEVRRVLLMVLVMAVRAAMGMSVICTWSRFPLGPALTVREELVEELEEDLDRAGFVLGR